MAAELRLNAALIPCGVYRSDRAHIFALVYRHAGLGYPLVADTPPAMICVR